MLASTSLSHSSRIPFRHDPSDSLLMTRNELSLFLQLILHWRLYSFRKMGEDLRIERVCLPAYCACESAYLAWD